MTDLIWIITSSVLILAVIAIRQVFGKKMSAGLRYALWAIVLLRLLIPGTVFSSPVSVHGAAESTEIVQNFEAVRGVDAIAYTSSGSVEGVTRRADPPAQAEVPPAPSGGTGSPAVPSAPTVVTSTLVENATPQRFTRMQAALKLRDILNYVWLIGIGLFTLYFAFTNVRFYLRLRPRRKRLDIESPVPVYSVEKLESSCLFLGSIYVSAPTAEQADRLRCVLEHEKAHRRHGDQIFALLRNAALILHWYNPLVWLAALLSRRDSELFADAGAVARLGETERERYGMTLIELSALRPISAPILSAATTMANGKRELKNRITHIAKKRRMSFAIAAAVLLAVAAAVFFTFAGCKSPENPGPDAPEVKVTDAPTAGPTEEPTEGPTAGPTAIPLPDGEWMLNEAWPYAELANETYPFNYTRESAKVMRDTADCCKVVFTDGDGPSLCVNFYYDAYGEWYVAGKDFFPSEAPDLTGLDLEFPELSLLFSDVTVTAEELAAAGYTPDGSMNDYIEVARVLARRVTDTYTGAPESSAFHCLEADPGEPHFIDLSVIGSEPVSVYTELYFLPANYDAFLYTAIEVFPGIAGPASPYPGRVSYDLPFVANIRTTSEGWACNLGYCDSVLNWGMINVTGKVELSFDDVMWQLIESDGLENVMRELYAIDWERFIDKYGEEGLDTLFVRLLEGSIGANRVYMDSHPPVMWYNMYPDDQKYRDMYMMLAALNAPESVKNRFRPILIRQKVYDIDAYMYCLDLLTPEQKQSINELLGSLPEGVPGDVSHTVILPAETELFTQEEINAAIETILHDFRYWYGCTLENIGYAGDRAVRVQQQYGADYEAFAAEKTIVLTSDFIAGPDCPDDSLGQNATYNGWQWILVYSGGRWIHVDHGFGY